MRNIGASTRSGHETMRGVLSFWFLLEKTVLVYSYNFLQSYGNQRRAEPRMLIPIRQASEVQGDSSK